MKKILAVLALIAIALGGLFVVTKTGLLDKKATGDYQTPTLFVHGYGGGYGSEKNMISDLSQHAGFRQVLKYTIDRHGNLSVTGHWQPDVKHPLIAVVFNDGRPNDTYLSPILSRIKKDYKIKAFNAVGHSGGATAWINWAVTADKAKMPELQRLVTIAGPFNGFRGMPEETDVPAIKLDSDGKPDTMIDFYKDLADNKEHFPKNIDVLNIFGDTGKGSDGVVPVNSARALRYIVEENAKSYTEQEVKNSKSQHSKLHQHNLLVNQVLYDFLK